MFPHFLERHAEPTGSARILFFISTFSFFRGRTGARTCPDPGRPRLFWISWARKPPRACDISQIKTPDFPDFASDFPGSSITGPTESEEQRRASPRGTPYMLAYSLGNAPRPPKTRSPPKRRSKTPIPTPPPHPPRYANSSNHLQLQYQCTLN